MITGSSMIFDRTFAAMVLPVPFSPFRIMPRFLFPLTKELGLTVKIYLMTSSLKALKMFMKVY